MSGYHYGERGVKFCDLITAPLRQGGHDVEYHRSVAQVTRELSLDYEAVYLTRKKGWRLFDFISLFIKSDSPRIFFLETIPFLDLVALTLASPFLKKRDRLFLLFRFEMKRKVGHRLLKFLKKENILLFSDSKRVAEGIGASVLPILHTDGLMGKVKVADDPLVLWWPGPPRNEKGTSIIRELTSQITNEKLYAHLKCQGICFLPELTREQYVKQMMRSDVILLPYDPAAYYARTSGIFVETVFAGKMPVVLRGSWLANELKEHDLEELIIDFTSLDEIAKLAKDPKILKKLKKMQQHYREYHSLENFKKVLSNYAIANEREGKGGEDGKSTHPHLVELVKDT